MPKSDSLIPNFSQIFAAAIGSVRPTPVVPTVAPAPAPGPMDKEIRRIHSAHQPEVREVASDNEIGRDIVEADARELAIQKKTVRKQQRNKPRGGSGI